MDWEVEDKDIRDGSLNWEYSYDDGQELDDNRLLYLINMHLLHLRQEEHLRHNELMEALKNMHEGTMEWMRSIYGNQS